ncbi:transcription-repair coupling factor [Candidatus Desulforudis audaxviator]|uniref:Transcription-repair-coupling factor n=1 Tax=Desulforudis audaxviator (strain MP104C) TaxID=477974 RepID=B1I198_DESAP|nr:transcription-repair coupling factor [Candidatus Desulforudis audaxviator]ACA58640.1 transcription-repair coupling factor [Candidatus Desulforudis audaxviator MP104C]AZK58638.1 Transcription-repair coupling factor [Candidatus Desulforudis audaxviator]
MQGLTEFLRETPALKTAVSGLARYKRQHVLGVGGGHQALVCAALARDPAPLLIITPGEREAAALADDLVTLLPGRGIFVFSAWELLPVQVLAYSREIGVRRMRVLEALITGTNPVVIAPVDALARLLPPSGVLRERIFVLEGGQSWTMGALRGRLLSMGYEAVSQVDTAGQFSIRGGIADLFPYTARYPIRVEFFGDEIASLRTFDPETQRSRAATDRVTVAPATELVVEDDAWEAGIETLTREYREQLDRLEKQGDTEGARRLREWVEEILPHLDARSHTPGIEDLLAYFYPQAATLMDYLGPAGVVAVTEPDRVAEVAESFAQHRAHGYAVLLEQGRLLPGQFRLYLDREQLFAALAPFRTVYLSLFGRVGAFSRSDREIRFEVRELPGNLGRTGAVLGEIRRRQVAGQRVVLLVGTGERARRLLNSLRQSGLAAFQAYELGQVQPGQVAVGVGRLNKGFEIAESQLAVLTEREIYGKQLQDRREPYRLRRRTLDELNLAPGDFVVHVNHGIGRYHGIVLLEIGEVKREYLLINYLGEDKLYVPTDQLGLVQKYIGAEGETPRCSRLGGSEWARSKKRVREAVREMAQELLKLYAARQSLPGYRFPADNPWQREFELAFPFEETPDQLKAIMQVKKDMERPRPMDRLLCGDVGYGKTEVAMRAVFKAVTDGKQAAVLVPTTVLAQQHLQTFRERFNGYPVVIEMLSRFRSVREQKQVLADLAAGKVDIVIGTHRLVQDDVQFADLGLIVVDEEQRFGVLHKEKLKLRHPNVDVITLTATPIPRTLYMSLVGIRDTSLLETPPLDRFPVQTFVVEEDPVLIREAVGRELARGGQVYFVHNRVFELDRVAGWLQELVPEARIAVAHGQMREDQLEQVMLDFVAGAYDVLVCTTIIETGLDITNVNTLVVKEADQLGLAQLYQLRGRVGRSNRLAYAYFTFRRDRLLGEAAEKRLRAIRDFTDFGSGFRLAKRDLEIRGAGNLLGTEQHGNISVVGFEMYCRLLEESVRELKGEAPPEEFETVVEVPVTAFLPDDYIPDPEQKVQFYHLLARVQQVEDVDHVAEELRDRFGSPPAPVENLLAIARIRAMAKGFRIKSINGQGRSCRFILGEAHPLDGSTLVAVSEHYPGRLRFKEEESGFEIWLKLESPGDGPRVIREIESFLAKISQKPQAQISQG